MALLLPWMPPVPTLTRSVVLVRRSRTNTSGEVLVSPATRFVAELWKATKRPSAEIQASKLRLLPCAPALLTLSRVVVAWKAEALTASVATASN